MRIAISAENNQGLDSTIGEHFGRCPFFIVLDVEEGEVKNVTGIKNPYHGNHKPGKVPAFIHEQGAKVMLAGGMGGRAAAVFEQMGITVVTGAVGTVSQALQRYLGGELQGFQPCAESEKHHRHQGQCSEHDQ